MNRTIFYRVRRCRGASHGYKELTKTAHVLRFLTPKRCFSQPKKPRYVFGFPWSQHRAPNGKNHVGAALPSSMSIGVMARRDTSTVLIAPEEHGESCSWWQFEEKYAVSKGRALLV